MSKLAHRPCAVGRFLIALPAWASYVTRNKHGAWTAYSHPPVRAVTPGHWSPTTGRCVTVAPKYLPPIDTGPWHTHLYAVMTDGTVGYLQKIEQRKTK